MGNARVPSPSEEKLKLRLRIASFIVIASLLVLTVTADTLGRLILDPTFHSDATISLALIGAIVGYGTVEALAALQGKKGEDG